MTTTINNLNVLYPPIKKVQTMNQFNINVLELKLFESVKLSVLLFDSDNIILDSRVYIIEINDYLQWNNDDKYILDWVRNRLQQETNY